MLTIQIALTLIILFIVLRIAARWQNSEIPLVACVSWMALWGAALVIVWRPSIASDAARLLGVGRGADLINYLAIIALFYLLFRISVRLERHEKHISALVEKIALGSATQSPSPTEPPAPHTPSP